MLLSLPKVKSLNFFEFFLFLFFFTLHADKLHFVKGGSSIRLNNVIALFLILFFIVRFGRKIFSFDRKFLWGIGALTFSIVLSLLFSPYRNRCTLFFGWYGLTLLGYLFLPYLFTLYFSVKRVFTLYFLSFLCVGCYAVLQCAISLVGIRDPFAEQSLFHNIARANAFAYEPSYYALYMTPFVMMTNLHYLLDKKRDFFIFKELKKRHLIVINFCFMISATASALFAYFVCLGLLPFFKSIPKKAIFKLLMGVIGSILLFTLLFPGVAKVFVLKFFFGSLKNHHSFFERWVGIENAWKIFKDHFFVGVGLGGVPATLHDAWLQGNTQFNYIVQERAGITNLKGFEPTNVLLEIAASLGIVGLLAFLFLFLSYGRMAYQAYKHATTETKQWITLFVISTLVSFIVLQFNQGILRTYIWTHFSLTFAFFQTIRSSHEAPSQWDGEKKREERLEVL